MYELLFSYVVHGVGVFLDPSWYSFIIYIRNLFYGFSLLFATILILDFLSFHHLFGPWAIIIGELLLDVGEFLVLFEITIVKILISFIDSSNSTITQLSFLTINEESIIKIL